MKDYTVCNIHKRRLIKWSVTALMAIMLTILGSGHQLVVFADEPVSGSCGENVTWTLDGSTLTISGEGEMTGYTYSANTPWKSYAQQAKTLVIEEGVTSVGKYAFRDMTAIETVSFPESLVSINDSAFYYCTSLREVSLTPNITYVGDCAFGYCRGLQYACIDTRKRTGSFSGKVSYGDVFFNDRINDIHITKDADVDINDLKGLAEVGTANTEEGRTDYAVAESIIFDPEKTELVYYSKTKEDTDYQVPETVTSISDYAFQDNYYLKTIDLGRVETIGYCAFYKASRLTSLYLPETLKTAGNLAFSDIGSKMNVVSVQSDFTHSDSTFQSIKTETFVIGDEVTAIPDLTRANTIDKYSVSEGSSTFMAENGVLYSKDGTELIAYPSARTQSVSFTIPSRVTKVADYAMSNAYGQHPKLTTVLPDDLRLEYVGDYAFQGIKIEGTVHLAGDYHVGEFAFASSTVESVVFGEPEDDGQTLEEGYESQRVIENGVFSTCKYLGDIEYYGGPPEYLGDTFYTPDPTAEDQDISPLLRYPVADFQAWDQALYDAEQSSQFQSFILMQREAVDRAVVLVVDTSSSMNGEPFEQLQHAAAKFVGTVLSDEAQAKAKTQMALITYSNEPYAIGFSSNRGTFAGRMLDSEPSGGTNMYDALACANRYLKMIDAAEKDLILMTDGIPQHGYESEAGPFSNSDSQYYKFANGVYAMYCQVPQSTRIFTLGFYHSDEAEKEFSMKLLQKIQNSGFFIGDTETFLERFEELTYTLLSNIGMELYQRAEVTDTEDGPVNNVTLQVRIENDDELTVVNSKAKIEFTDADSNGLVLAPGETEEIAVGDIVQGKYGDAIWHVHCPVITEDRWYQIAVVLGGDNINPVKKFFDVYVPAASSDDFKYIVSTNEKWSFAHYIDKYYLSDALRNRLEKILTSSEMSVVKEKYLNSNVKWEGNCYGMSVSAAMFKNGEMTADSWQNGAVTASDISLNDNTKSMLTYFQVLQNDVSLVEKYIYSTVETYTFKNGETRARYKPLKTRLTKLIDTVEKNGNAVITFQFGGYHGKSYQGYGHAILAYGKPFKLSAPYELNGVKYDMCIKTYDVNTCTGNSQFVREENSYVYYKSDLSAMCIPCYQTNDYSICIDALADLTNIKLELLGVIDDISIFHDYNPENEFRDKETADDKNRRLQLSTDSSNLQIKVGNNSNSYEVRGPDIAEELGLWAEYELMIPAEGGSSWLKLTSFEPDETYIVQNEEDGPLNIIAQYGESASFVEGSTDASATLSGPGEVAVSDNDGEYSVRMVLDKDAGFGDEVTASGSSNSSITITKEAECFRISTDDESLSDVSLAIDSGGEKAETTLNTDLNTVFVSADGSEGITVRDKMVQIISAADKTIEAGKTVSIGAKASTALTYRSSNPGIATVSADGTVRGIKAGKAVITINAAESDEYEAAKKQINITVTAAKPAEITDLPAVKIAKPKAAKKSVTVKWKKVSKKNQKKIRKIQIQVATDKAFNNIVKTATGKKTKMSAKVKGLKSRKTYYVRVRAYKITGGTVHVSKWSRVMKVKVK